MTGWRVGYVAAPQYLVSAMTSFQSHTTSNPASISQKAALAALGAFDPEKIKIFQARRDFVLENLRRLPGISVAKPDGAFYIFPNAAKWLGLTYTMKDGSQVKLDSVDTICELLLTDVFVSVVQGSGFGAPHNFRISYATSMPQLQKAMDRFAEFADRLN